MALYPPVYLFTGPEFGERNEAVNKVKNDLRAKFGDSEEHLRYFPETKISEVIAELNTDSLFCPATCVVLKGAEQIKSKEDIDLLKEWIESVTPSPSKKSVKDSSVLILVSDETSVDAKLKKLIPSVESNQKIFWEMFDNQKERWLQNFFQKNGLSLTPDACDMILEMVENNTESLKSECGIFFACFPQGTRITEDDVEKALSHNRQEDGFSLFAAMANIENAKVTRFEKALSILQKLFNEKNSGVGIDLIAKLTSCFRRLIVWHTLSENNNLTDVSMKQNGFVVKKAQTQYRNAAKIWTKGQTAAILALLEKSDGEIRASGTALEYNILNMMLYEIIIKGGVYSSSYTDDWEL